MRTHVSPCIIASGDTPHQLLFSVEIDILFTIGLRFGIEIDPFVGRGEGTAVVVGQIGDFDISSVHRERLVCFRASRGSVEQERLQRSYHCSGQRLQPSLFHSAEGKAF